MPRYGDLIGRALRTNTLVAAEDGSVKFAENADARWTDQLSRVLTENVVTAIQDPGHEWTKLQVAIRRRQRNAGDAIAKLGDAELDVLEAIRQRIAQQAIEEKWTELGGPRSDVGLPLTNQIMLRDGTDGGYDSAFRSGSMSWKPGKPLELKVENWVEVRFVGLECGIKQETTDEIYGTVTCQVPSVGGPDQVTTHPFPGDNATIDFDADHRLWLTNDLLYTGPIANVRLSCSLIENDSGDVEDILKKVTELMAKEVAGPLGDVVGLPAETITDQPWYEEGIREALGSLLDGIFGAGDDPYTPASLSISWTELMQVTPSFRVTNSEDAEGKVIERATHKLLMEGEDDGGDHGQYAAYFYVHQVPGPQA